ncbi:MAG TPA: C4-dicarboxylate ABC transporter [Desulfobacteraceae bacterium]|nr:C4-dicarboxylate ABC transporter [Desulfobacteraceae bacterium]
MKKIILFTAALILATAYAHAATTIKIATLSPDGSMWMEKMRKGADAVAQKTEHRVEIRFYTGGVMGDDKSVIRKIHIGQLHGGAVISGSMTQFYPDNQIYAMPLKFRSLEEVDYIRKNMDKFIAEGLEKSGFMTFGLAEGGFAYLMSKEPVKNIEELRKRKVWIPDDDSAIFEAVKAFGINPIPLSIADVRAGLQTGLIDTVATSPVGAIALQWHTQVKYLLDMPFLYLYALLAVDKKAYQKLSPGDQKILSEEMGRAFSEIGAENRKDDEKASEALKKQGIQFLTPTPDDMKEWLKISETVPDRLIKSGKLSPDILKTFEGHLNDFRAKAK